MLHLIVEFLQNQAHRPRQSAQVIILFGESIVEGLEIGHPFRAERAVKHVDLVEQDHQWSLRLVQYR